MPTKKKRQSKKPDGDGIPKDWPIKFTDNFI